MRSVFLLLSACVATSFAADSCDDADTQSLLQAKRVVRKHSAEHVADHNVEEAEADRNSDVCEIGEDVLCSDGVTMCAGDQCCPDGSTCPSAHAFHADGCQAPKARECTAEGQQCAFSRNTGGTCFFSPCYDWRGETECRWGRCMCARGSCSTRDPDSGNDGVCYRQRDWINIETERIEQEEGWVDSLLQIRSPVACDVNEDVMCPDGVTMCSGNQCCPDQSTCPSAPDYQAEGCNVKADGHDCVEEAARQQAEADLQHQCSQSRDTGGTCAWFGCYGWRGNTVCEDSKCLCQEGECAANGVCHDAHAWAAFQDDPDFVTAPQ